MSRPAAVGFVLAFLLAATIGPVGGGLTAAATTSGSAPKLALQQDFDSTEFHVTVYENGSARWTFKYMQEGLNESEREQFEAFAADFNSGETELYTDFKRRATLLVREGGNVTGRNMTATGFSKRAGVEGLGNRGVVRMSFVWTNFAATDGEKLVVGDVFDGGLYIGPNQSFVVEHGPNLTFQRYQPHPDAVSPSNETLTWRGERSFSHENPYVVLAPAGQGDGTDSPAGPTEGDAGVLPFVALGFAILIGGVLAYAYRSGALDGYGDGNPTTEEPAGPDATGAEPAISDEELLSDEDRVVELLEDHGGRMKQVNIVEETGWSKSKVSMLLSDMEDEGHISKLRVGRENIVSLAGHEPDAAGSPFDEDDDEEATE